MLFFLFLTVPVTRLVEKKKTAAYQEKSLIAFFISLLRTKTIKVIFLSVRIEQPQNFVTHCFISISSFVFHVEGDYK